MLYFRCYKCWTPIEDEGDDNYIECPECTAVLYTGEIAEKLVEATVVNPPHQSLLRQLISGLKRNREIEKGKTEVIAGEDTRHRPDAIYYYKTGVSRKEPIIFEIETCDSIDDVNTASQSMLFSQTAENTGGDFYLVVPEFCNDEKGKVLVKKMLDEYGIEPDYVEIMPL